MADVLTVEAFNYFLTVSLIMIVPIFILVEMVRFFK